LIPTYIQWRFFLVDILPMGFSVKHDADTFS